MKVGPASEAEPKFGSLSDEELSDKVAEALLGRARGDWNPASEIEDAWEIVEAIRAVDFDVDVTAHAGVTYGCRIAPRGQFATPDVIFKDAVSAPRAICWAALEWNARFGRRLSALFAHLSTPGTG